MVSYFMKLFKELGIRRPKLNVVQFRRISANSRVWLERPFEEEEVKRVVWSIEDVKALGSNGFTMAFFKQCWDIIKNDLMDTMANFHDQNILDLRSNATFISLIPNCEHANRVSDFRPISFVGSVYKILAKTLACRMKVILLEIISPNQSAFLEGRQSIDDVLVTNECMEEIIRKGDLGILCKLDLEKAYDRVNWTFLYYMLRKMGFGNIWCKWIKKKVWDRPPPFF